MCSECSKKKMTMGDGQQSMEWKGIINKMTDSPFSELHVYIHHGFSVLVWNSSLTYEDHNSSATCSTICCRAQSPTIKIICTRERRAYSDIVDIWYSLFLCHTHVALTDVKWKWAVYFSLIRAGPILLPLMLPEHCGLIHQNFCLQSVLYLCWIFDICILIINIE